MEVCRIHLPLTDKVKTLLVSGAVRGHMLVCNRAAFILDFALLCSSLSIPSVASCPGSAPTFIFSPTS